MINSRLSTLRKYMSDYGIFAYIIPSSDPHLSEYVPDNWKRREWISGFDGSAGTVVVTNNEACLWTDSRYYLQAELQLSGSEFILFRDGESGVPDWLTWLAEKAPVNCRVGIDSLQFSYSEFANMSEKLSKKGISIASDLNFENALFSELSERKAHNDVFALSANFAGVDYAEKLDSIRKVAKNSNADILIISALDEIAWLLNIRGNDVEYNPVVSAYVAVSEQETSLFIDIEKIDKCKAIFDNITVRPYDDFFKFVSSINDGQTVWLDPNSANTKTVSLFGNNANLMFGRSPITLMKAKKNNVEIEGVKRAVVRDAAALTRAFMWLEKQISLGKKVTEFSFSEKLKNCREEQDNFFCESFGTIAGFGANGAIVHYKADEANASDITSGNMLLVDSGGNYFDGTTDITRTVFIGSSNPTKQQKNDYTAVLKGHIALASAIFPAGTHGSQLDCLARQFLWNCGLNYGHGTGHGIGHFLCVHEGPQNIRPRDNGIALEQGMLLSNEPGVYRTGEYGIRLENMVLVTEHGSFDGFLKFETLSLFPFDKKLINFSLLSSAEKEWLCIYHQNVYNSVAPHISEEEKLWLKNRCDI